MKNAIFGVVAASENFVNPIYIIRKDVTFSTHVTQTFPGVIRTLPVVVQTLPGVTQTIPAVAQTLPAVAWTIAGFPTPS